MRSRCVCGNHLKCPFCIEPFFFPSLAKQAGEDRIIFLIDARHAMFEKNRSGEVHIENCMKVALAVMKTKIIASEKSAVGVIFFGAKIKSDKTEGVHVLFPLESPTAKAIRELHGLVEDMTLFNQKVGSSDAAHCPLRDAFSVCHGAFAAASGTDRPHDFRRIWLFTNDDNPNADDSIELGAMVQVRTHLASHLAP